MKEVGGRREAVVGSAGGIKGSFLLDEKHRKVIVVKEWTKWEQGVSELAHYKTEYPGYTLELHLFRGSGSTNMPPSYLQFVRFVCKSHRFRVTIHKGAVFPLSTPWWKTSHLCCFKPSFG
eukprot:jgi/Mesvir1/15779/Mv03348-RA.1